MFQNYVKVALRSLIKGRLYSVINILGLSVGIAVCVLMLMFVSDELSYDKFHANSDRIYRAWVKEHFKDQVLFNTVTPIVLASALEDNFPEIESVTHYINSTSAARNASFSDEEEVVMADPGFLKLFDFQMLSGSRTNALSEKHTALITTSISRKYFGDQSPVGKTLELQIDGEWTLFLVDGVLEEPPSNSSIQYSIIIPFENANTLLSEQAFTSWTIIYAETYVMLKEGVAVDDLLGKIAPFIDEKVSSSYDPGEYIVGFQPITDIHLGADFPAGLVQVSDSRYPIIFAGIALLILLLACINFTTIAIGRSVTRAKEVGVRKISGATRTQIMLQFWSEAIITVIIAVVLGLFIAIMVLPLFNAIAGKSLVFTLSPIHLVGLLGLTMITGLIAGIYPSLVLSRFSPMQVIRGVLGTKGGDQHIVLRWLVGLQYVISIILIICTLVIQRQMQYMQNKDLGYNDEQIVALPYRVSGQGLRDLWRDAKRITEVLRNDLAGNADVLDISTSSHTFGVEGWYKVGYVEKSTDRFRQFTVQQVEPNYVDMMQLQMVQGRGFRSEPDADLKSVVINEAMAEEYGWDDPIGQSLPGPFLEFQVVGVTQDFHFSTLHNPIAPMVMAKDMIPIFQAAPDHNWTDPPIPKIAIKLSKSNLQATLSTIKDAWKKAAPGQPFNYTFLDEQTAKQYEAEARLSRLLGIATGLAIFIACLGLFGIGILTIARRTKEIGVRRVLGASTSSIIILLNKPFSILVIVGALLASPIAWYVMNGWLQDYAYRVKISPMIFVLAIVIALLLAWLSVGFQTIRAAMSSPVESLRDD